ncbi:hypothetical protein BDP55DRAFT_639266 [Colletotrichum godetiae]|uniref:Uncharacterized protein n=1 Tax=Colletotrichum godetiae TaxID=1209918 RepID=A0AAJ0A896_9PEZI|nr:uncharacterized protein BDP55DRAFT_639266 [Colletotrichum godetiae]KAK1656842.1 hypothetical protein BDP55DRAFT_639266 [Colletotrichum godetiae]
MSAYHWQIICYLAWFSSITHVACLSALRTYFFQHRTERNYRLGLIVILLAGLITALIPTGYFNWSASLSPGKTASLSPSNARCFSWRKTAQALHDSSNSHYYGRSSSSPPRSIYRRRDNSTIEWTLAFETSTTSILILTFSFFGRASKLFRKTSQLAKNILRETLGHWAVSCLQITAVRCRKFGTTPFRKTLLAVFRPLDLTIATYLVAKVYMDAVSSELADLLWLIMSLIWGTFRLVLARVEVDIGDSEDAWSFSQVLPVFLLLGPLLAVLVSFLHAPNGQAKERQRTTEGDMELIDQLVRSLRTRQDGIVLH